MLFVPALRRRSPNRPCQAQRAVPDDLLDNQLEIQAVAEEAILTETMNTTAMPMVLVATANNKVLKVIPVSPDPQMVTTRTTTTRVTTSLIEVMDVQIRSTY